jgi:Mrp family chromosome partitioning ATPase
VALVEADLRLPRAANYLGLDSTVGLTNVLVGQHTLTDVLVSVQGGPAHRAACRARPV